MKKLWIPLIKILVLAVVSIAPFAGYCFYVDRYIPNCYEETFFGELPVKYKLLKNTKEKKIIFVGCSSLPFALRSDVIDEEFPEYKVVNYGLYGAIGTKFMMDTSKVNISKGDIVVLAPEISEQTYSTYFNPEITLQATDGFSEMFKHLDLESNISLFANFFPYSLDKIGHYKNNSAPDPVGIYRRDSFNEYGDVYIEREHNIMLGGYDTTSMITPKEELLTDDFVEMVNKYIKYVRRKGAEIYFNFSPSNDLSIGSSRAKRDQFEKAVQEKIHCKTLMSLDECILNYLYFYDTNYHLNSIGSLNFTNHLVAALKDQLGIEHDPVEDIPPNKGSDDDVPDIPDIPVDFEEYRGEPNNDFLDCFNYRLIGKYYRIESVKDEYKDLAKVIVPTVYEGKTIKAIASNAFSNFTNIKDIYIGNHIRSIEKEAFNGCDKLEGIHLFQMDGSLISVPSTGLLDGCNPKVKIYIPKGSNYAVGYIWDSYSDYFEEVDFDED